jgi:cysteine sulfinate desulfinase/cysteine desulfurase-like protein
VRASLRVGLGRSTTEGDVDAAADALARHAQALRSQRA